MTRCGIDSAAICTIAWRFHGRLRGILGRLFDSRRNLIGLAVAPRHAAIAVADNDESVET